MLDINFSRIETKWQKKWEEKKVYEVKEGRGKKYYVCEMYPYPSANGLHMGHAFNYVIGDILARYMRMKGHNVLHPMGFDSFGLPAENAAIKSKLHPKKFTEDAIKNFIRQQKALGLSYDWNRLLWSHDTEYYKWNQFFFLKMLEKGLAYRKKSSVNWCEKCNSVLANEQVVSGRCWRHSDTEVKIKQLEQWFVKTTEYADELLSGIEKLDWPERIKSMQRNWIGKSEGTEIDFLVDGKKWSVFTTRADTLFGVTFLVISANHARLMEIVSDKQKKEVDNFVKKIKSTKQEDMDKLDKEGVFTGAYAKHPLTGEKIPIWAGNFVVADYGSGMVMAVPAHDSRDFDFAKKYGLEIKEVVSKDGKKGSGKMKEAFTDYGILSNSSSFDGLQSDEAIEHIAIALKGKALGRKTINYKLRDWLISRQRYWGTPIPVVYCDDCGIIGVPEKELPVVLPDKVEFGKGNPLETNKKFVEAKCPECGGKGRRETDTMDTFFDSSWYYLRYMDAQNKKEPFDKKKAEYWMPVDFYTGGAEHAVMHLIYARFFTKFLRDLGYVKFDEPFKRLFNQGMVHGEDGKVMSKSAGNGIDPLDAGNKYGIDALRMFLVSNAAADKDYNWSQTGIEGGTRFMNKLTNYFDKVKTGKSSKRVEHKVNYALKGIEKDLEYINYNLAIIKIRELLDVFISDEVGKKDLESYVKVLSIFCPHISEELWEKMGNKGFVVLEDWPKVDEKKIDENIEKAEQAGEKTVSDILNILKIVKERTGGESKALSASRTGSSEGKEVKKVYLYCIPNEIGNYNEDELGRRTGLSVSVFAVNDKKKYDPEGKAGKAKPGKPGIFVE